MAFKRIEGTLPNGNPRTLIRAIALNASQFKMVQDIIALYNGETVLTRKQLMDANTTLRPGKIYMPYFIGKNVICKTKTNGIFDLSRLKLASGAKSTTTEPKKVVKSKAKKEAKAKREKKPVVDAPVTTEEVSTLAEAVKTGEISFTDAVSSILS